MRATDITEVLKTDKLKDLSTASMMEVVTSAMLRIFTLSGAAKGYDKQQLKEEIGIFSSTLLSDLRNEFSELHSGEIGYAFMCGLKGDFQEKTFGLNYKTFYTWLSCYYFSPERAEAINNAKRLSASRQIAPTSSLTEYEKEEIIKNNIQASYQLFLAGPYQASAGTMGSVIAGQYNIQDLGGAMKRYLVRVGKMNISETVGGFFVRMKKQSVKNIFENERD